LEKEKAAKLQQRRHLPTLVLAIYFMIVQLQVIGGMSQEKQVALPSRRSYEPFFMYHILYASK
jgi:hypothetical protein